MTDAYRRFLERLDATRTLGVQLGLERMRAALEKLGSPQNSFASVQIAGTNGKGSTAAMTEAVLRQSGFRTGLFTSPHLSRFTERIRINGSEIDQDDVARFGAAVFETGVPLTYFEVGTAIALLAMAEAGVELAVLETGLGGRLDATTAVTPVATGITSIGYDHTEILGDTLEAIAAEKAGIAKAGVPLFVGDLGLGPAAAAVEAVIAAAARTVGAPLMRVTPSESRTAVALEGRHQRSNAALAVALARQAAQSLGAGLSERDESTGLANVRWPGRMEWVLPDVLLDCAHNPQGIQAVVASLPERHPRALVISIVGGKDVAAMARVLAPLFGFIAVTRCCSDRALDPAALLAGLPPGKAGVVIEPSPWTALGRARAFAASTGPAPGFTLVTGSIFLVGELRAQLLGEDFDSVGSGDPPVRLGG